MSTATAITLWLLAGVVSLLWFWPTAAAYPYPRPWMRRVDCTIAFLLGPIGLVLNALMMSAGWVGRRHEARRERERGQ